MLIFILCGKLNAIHVIIIDDKEISMSFITIIAILAIAVIACVFAINTRTRKAIEEKKAAERAARKKQGGKKKKKKK